MGGICSTPRADQVAPAPPLAPLTSPSGKVLDATAPLQRAPTRPKLPPLEVRLDQSPVQPFTPTSLGKPPQTTSAPEPELPSHLATVGKGVSLRGLRNVRDAIRKHFGEKRYTSVTTTEVCHKWVKTVTAPVGKCRLVEAPGLVDAGDVGRPMYFISHAWSNSIELLFRKVFDFLASADDSTRVWLDVLAVCQHESMPAHKHDITAFADVVAACSGGTLVVMDLTRCNPSTRAWCVFEWAHTLAAHGPDGLHMQLAPLERAAVFADLDVERAECFRPADKKMIMHEVRRQHGSPENFNAKLKLQLLLEPLSYTVDLRRLQERSRDTAWDFTEVEHWVNEASKVKPGAVTGAAAGAIAPGSRALCVVSGAGEGKSTISAELVRRLSPPAPGGGGPRLSSSGGGSLARSPVICAYHFLKYNDQRRLEPVRIIKTMAFQLASRLPAMCATLLDSDVAEVAQLTDADRAFEELLLRPLRGRTEPVVIVVDALDEADPAPYTYAADPSGLSSPTGAPRRAGGPTFPVLCGNRALQLITKHLQRLPPAVRFFVTTRPDAASGQVVPALERTFHGQGGSAYIKPSQLVRAVTSQVSEVGSGGAAAGPVTPSGGVMVYHTVVRDCLGDAKDDDASTSAPGTPTAQALGGSRQSGSSAVVVAAGPPAASKSRKPASLLMMLTGMGHSDKTGSGSAAASPGGAGADLTALYHVYGKVFRKAYDSYEGRRRADVSQLLDVLMAAQEPLSQSLVQQLGLGHAVALLPGFPTLFYVDEHHLFTLHKSLADWLLIDAVGSSGDKGSLSGNSRSSRDESSKSLMAGGSPLKGSPAPGNASSRSLFARIADKRSHASQQGPATGVHFAPQPAIRSSNSFFGTRANGDASRAAIESEAAAEAAHAAAAAAAAAAPSPSFAIDVSQGHLLLGRYLSSTRNSAPSSYCLKYLVTHLAAAGPAAAKLLDEVLASFAFIQAVFAAGFGANVIRALGSMSHSTRLSKDALRWLGAKQHDIVATAAAGMSGVFAATAASAGGGGGAGGPSTAAAAVVGSALMSPIGTILYRVAVRAAEQGWRTRTSIPSYEDWPADQAVLKGHTGNVTCVLFSPDGRQLVSSSGGGYELRVWDISSGTCTAVLLGHTAEVTCLAISADGHVLASGSNDTTCRLWDAATGLCTSVLQGHTSGVTGVSFSPPERGKPSRLVTASPDNTLRIWAPAPRSPKARKQSHLRPPSSRTDSQHRRPSALAVVSVTGSDVTGAPTAGAEPCSHACTAVLQGKDGGLQGVAWCSDGKRLAGAHGPDVCIWSLGPNKVTATLSGHQANVLAVAFNPTEAGRRLASCGWDKVVKIWDTRTSRCLANLTGHTELVRAIAWSPNGRRLASASSDNTLRIWDATPTLHATGAGPSASANAANVGVPCTAMLRGSEWMTAVSFSPDGRTLASGNVAKELRLWDVAGCEAEHAAAQPLMPSASSRLRLHLTDTIGKITQKSLKLLSVAESGDADRAVAAAAAAARPSAGGGHTADVTCVTLSPDGTMLATAAEDRTIRLYDSGSARWLATLEGHSAGVTSVAWAPPGHSAAAADIGVGAVTARLASVSHDLTVRIWRLEASEGPGGHRCVKAACTATLSGHTDRIRSVAWSPAANGDLATGAEDNHVRLWNADSGTSLAPMWGHGGYVVCVAYCPADRGGTVTSAAQDNTIRVWDTVAQKCARVLQGHDHYVNHITYTPCGTRLASASCDQTIRIWDHASGKCLTVLQGHTHFVNWVSFEPQVRPAGAGHSGNGDTGTGTGQRRRPPLPLRLASASTDCTLRVWDLKTRKCMAALGGHSAPVYCVTWMPGGSGGGGGGAAVGVDEPQPASCLVSGAADRSVRIWCEGYDFDD